MAINFANVKAFTISQYEQRSYIQSNGTDNYIPLNTRFSGEIDIDFSMDSLPYGGCLIGDGYNGISSNFEIVISRNGKIYVSFGMNDTHEIATLTTGVRYKLKMKKQSVISFEVYNGDTLVGSWSDYGSFSTNNLYLCAYVNSYNNTLNEKMACKIYSLGMGTVDNVHDVVPVRNKATSAVGLCDPTKSSQYFMGMEGTIDSSSIGEVVEPVTALPGLDVIQIQNSSNVILWQKKRVESITLSGQNSSLNKDSIFIFGGTVTATYSDGTTADVTTSTTFTGYDMSTAGEQTVTASYTERGVTVTATYTLTVVAEGWHTIWEGSKTIRNNGGTISGTSNNFAYSASGTGYRPKLRLTFTNMTNTGRYYNNNNTPTTMPSSPLTINQVVDVDNARILGVYKFYNTSYYSYGVRAYLKAGRDGTNNRLKFSLNAETYEDGSYGYDVQFTLTKIEQYY